MSAGFDLDAGAADVRAEDLDPTTAFVTFDQQDSGCFSYGVEVAGRRWFVKSATTPVAVTSLRNAMNVHGRCHHHRIVSPACVVEQPTLTLVYPWRRGKVLNHATLAGSDRSALFRFRRLPLEVIEQAIAVVLDAHIEIVRCGLVAVDFYDGCLLYDFDGNEMWLIDLDEYRPGPFVLETDRLPGSTSYMAPEESIRGAVIDQRTTVFNLGRMIDHLLTTDDEWRGTKRQRGVVDVATDQDPARRHDSVASFVDAWVTATSHRRITR